MGSDPRSFVHPPKTQKREALVFRVGVIDGGMHGIAIRPVRSRVTDNGHCLRSLSCCVRLVGCVLSRR